MTQSGGATDNSAMASHAPRLSLSLDPLIAEAKRRARQRRVLVAVAVVLVVSGGVGAAIVASRSSGVATGPRPIQAAVGASFFGGLEQPDGPVGVFSPRFGVPVIVGNGSREPVSLESVAAVFRAHFPVRQIGARFTQWERARACWGAGLGAVCATRPITDERPSPFRLAPGHRVLVQLNFRLLACSKHIAREVVSVQRITAVYRLPNGTQIHQRLTAISGSSNPDLVRPGSLPKNLVAGPVGLITTRPCHQATALPGLTAMKLVKLSAIVRSAAKADGDTHPSSVMVFATRRHKANIAAGAGSGVPGSQPVYLVVVRGHFVCSKRCPGLPDAVPPRGDVITMVLDRRTLQALDSGIGGPVDTSRVAPGLPLRLS